MATWFEEVRYNVRLPLCATHKTEKCKQYDAIELIDDEELAPVVVRLKDWLNPCKHLQIELDQEAKTTHCSRCGKTIDPFVVLEEYAKGYRLIDYKINAMAERNRQHREAEERRKIRAINKSAKAIGVSVVK